MEIFRLPIIKSPLVSILNQSLWTLGLSRAIRTDPGGGPAVVIDEEGPTVGRYPHLPARGQEALLGLVLGLGGAVRGGLRRLRVGERVLHRPPHLDVVGSLEINSQGKEKKELK